MLYNFASILVTWGLRDYGIDGQLGLEKTPEQYVSKMVEIFREVRRVLRKDGTLFLNLGDTYFGSGGAGGDYNDGGLKAGQPKWKQGTNRGSLKDGNRYSTPEQKPKDLCGIPWAVAFALRADGWWLRQDIIWCLSGGTKVYARTQKGIMPTTLKDMYRLKPETVELWNGKFWTRLKGMSKHPRQGNEIELVLRSGERISCTPEHKWPTESGLKKATELKTGDVLKACFLQDVSFPKNPKHIPDDMGWFVGIYLAEGSRDSGGTIQIASHKNETERYNRLQQVADAYGCTCRKHDISKNGMTICMDGKVLNSIIDTYIAGKTAKDKHLSNACWQRSISFLKSILDGYLEGDGHWDKKNRRWRLGFTRNYNLESDIRTLCSIIQCNLTLNLSKSYIGSKKYDSFRGEIKFEATIKGHWNQKNKGEIVEIRKARARYFYSVGVEDEPHLFALASGVLTHNSKPNPMPESVTDRCTKSHEYIFLMSKSQKYYYDNEAIKEKSKDPKDDLRRINADRNKKYGVKIGNIGSAGTWSHKNNGDPSKWNLKYTGRNKRSVWTIPTKPYKEAHFATFPPALILPCILAGTAENQTILDPFAGSGTVWSMCEKYNRKSINIELSGEYSQLIKTRITNETRQLKLFN